jgi:hypothetical protein
MERTGLGRRQTEEETFWYQRGENGFVKWKSMKVKRCVHDDDSDNLMWQLFICGVFNNSVSISDYVASNDRVVNE